MKREIKFRAKIIGDNEWIYGGGVQTFGDKTAMLHDNGQGATLTLVQIETVGQYIDLKDKNEKEIYEGDTVKSYWQHDGIECHDYELVGNIFWNPRDACFSLDCSDRIIRFITTYEREDLIEIEIIGNIYNKKRRRKRSG
jgi:uncharacterized phage protein (TIGR01671 family)